MIKQPIQKGKILISEPFLNDPNFKRSVVLLVEHNEDGTIGFVLNQITDVTTNTIWENFIIPCDVYQGGPVELSSFHFIHQYASINDSFEVSKGLYWGGDMEQMVKGINSGLYEINKVKFVLGYSGWAPNQLLDEVMANSWVVSDIELHDIFNKKTDEHSFWQEQIKKLGGDYRYLANSPINPSFN